MNVQERIAAFRRRMAEEGFEAVIVPTADSHASEYIADAKAALPDDMSEKIANSYIRIADYIADRKS